MNFSFKTALWKAIRSAALASLVVLLSSGTLDVFFGKFGEGLSPIIPIWAVPIVAGGLTLLRNFVKQWLAKLPSE